MSSYILDRAYEVTDSNGVEAYSVVVCGEEPGQCRLPYPLLPNAPRILGITVHSQSLRGEKIAIRKAGIARVKAVGVVGYGDPVNTAGGDGSVKAIDEPAGTKVNCVGFAETSCGATGGIIEVFISLHQRIA